MSAAVIASALHGVRNGRGWLCRCPVRGHGQGRGDMHRSLSLADGHDQKLLVWCFGRCKAADILLELRRLGLLESRAIADDCRKSSRATRNFDLAASPHPEPDPDPRALDLWRQAVPAENTLVEKYLRARGFSLIIPPSLRFIHDLYYMQRISLPAMIAAVQRPDRKIIAVQLTYLDPSGDRKAQVYSPRKTIGKLGRGAVRLGPAASNLGFAEGVESALAAMQIFGMPVWAVLGASRMPVVAVPAGVEILHVYADNDVPGRDAAMRTVNTHRSACKVIVHTPAAGDCADALRSR